MRVVETLLSVGLFAALPAAADAAGACYKQRMLGAPLGEDERLCRLNALVDEWLSERGIGTEEWLQTQESVKYIGDNGDLFDVFPMKSSAVVEVAFWLGREESMAVHDLIAFRPGFYKTLESVLRREGKAIVCETMSENEQSFIELGGEINYRIVLSPSIIDGRTPGRLAHITFPHYSCEAL